MSFGSMLDQLAWDLNDAGPSGTFVTWTREQIRAYLEEAIQLAATSRPDLFIETRIMKVQPCTLVQDTCDCTNIRRVIGQSTKDGRVFKRLRKKKGDETITWTGRVCSSPYKNFELVEYSIDDTTDKLWLYPVVPPGKDIYVVIECSVAPSGIQDSYEIPSELTAPIRQWVLFLAKSMDGEYSSEMITQARLHKDTFFQLLAESKDEDNDITVDSDND